MRIDPGPIVDGAAATLRPLERRGVERALGERPDRRVQATALDSSVASERVPARRGFARERRLSNLQTGRGERGDLFVFAKTTPGTPAR